MTTRTRARARRSPWLLANLALFSQRGIRVGHQASPAIDVTRRGAVSMLRRWPRAVARTRAGARLVSGAIQTLPRSTAQSLTAGSLGFGAGLYLGRVPRVVKAMGVAPAIVLGVSLLRRRDGDPEAQPSRPPGSAFTGDTGHDRLDDDGSPVAAAPGAFS